MKPLATFLFTTALTITCFAQDSQTPNRPQEPQAPYPYLAEEITFQNQESNITLGGTLTLPKDLDDFPVVVLISGSSPHNRNQEIAGHKPFLVLADYLTKNGIGVLRYDDRGVGQSEGTYEIAGYSDRTSDVLSAVAFLKTRKEINPDKIGLIGHSEGGLIAPRVAAQSTEISFIIMLAAPALPGNEQILLQTQLSNKAQGISEAATKKELEFLTTIFDNVIESSDLEKTKADLLISFKENPGKYPQGVGNENVEGLLETFTATWFQRILTYDPTITLSKVRCPVLALNGEKDLQIPPKENLAAITNALKKGGNQRVTITELPGLNHLFQEAQTGSADEFGLIEQTLSPTALETIKLWIKEQY